MVQGVSGMQGRMTTQLPRMLDVMRKRLPAPACDYTNTLPRQFGGTGALSKLRPGAPIAIAIGSRGISNLKEIVSIVIASVRRAGGSPYVVPAMGSHGGGTPEGQAHLLAEYGLTPESLGVRFETKMDVRCLGISENGVEVTVSEAALESDGIVIINRVKPHTDFHGAIGSGILKMMAIGLGKYRGAGICHAAASRLGHEAVIRGVARVILAKAPILCGVAIVEDGDHQTADVQVLMPQNLERREQELFVKAQSLMPRLPFDEIDLLVVDFMGKDLSGSGIDTNVIGRSVHGYSASLHGKEGRKPRVHRIFVRELTPASNGNVTGIGLADFTTSRVVRQINRRATYTNALTALVPSTVKIPIYFDTDREVLNWAIASLALQEPTMPRIVRIANTLSLDNFQASELYADQILARSDFAVTRPAHDMEFDSGSNLVPL
jgi:Lactate racemase N-terminal domain